ncbi:unnamed protein product [Ixodes pacificus]
MRLTNPEGHLCKGWWQVVLSNASNILEASIEILVCLATWTVHTEPEYLTLLLCLVQRPPIVITQMYWGVGIDSSLAVM